MADKSQPPPARLFVLLARNAPVGVILRRGPSDWVQIIQWNMKTDVFKPGQWFHGRIFEHRCDLSPDGKFFAYCAFKPGNRLKNPTYGDNWTAVSKPPHLTALALWTRRNSDGGGGYFEKDGRMFLNHLDDNQNIHPAYRLPKELEVKTIKTYDDEAGYMFNDIHSNVMRRGGWDYISSPAYFPASSQGPLPPEDTLSGTLAKTQEGVTLLCEIILHRTLIFYPRKHEDDRAKKRRRAKFRNASIRRAVLQNPYRSTTSHRYQYALKIEGNELPLNGVTWADFDRSKRLVLAKEGKLFAGEVVSGELKLTELADFNANRP